MLGAIFLMYSWMLLVSAWIMALTVANLHSLFSLLLESQVAGLWVEPSVYGREFSCLDITGIYLLLWLAIEAWYLETGRAYMLMTWYYSSQQLSYPL